MKKHIFVLACMIIIALLATSCSSTANPIPGIQNPQPGNPVPQDQQPGGPQPQGPLPQNLQGPQGPQPQGPQPGGPQPQGPMPNNPGPQPQGPTPNNPGTGSSGSSGSNHNPSPTFKMEQAVKAIMDLGISNIYPSSSGKIMVTIKNTGNMAWSGKITIMSVGDWRTCDVCQYASATTSAAINLAAGATTDVDTGLGRQPSLSHQAVTCTMSNFTATDSDNSNNSKGPVTVK